MLEVRSKNIALLWELNSIFVYILHWFIVLTANMAALSRQAALSRGWKPRIATKKKQPLVY